MTIQRTASAGTLESGDALVTVEPRESGIELELSGPSMLRYRDQIEAAIAISLSQLAVRAAVVRLQEKGALDCTIRARLVAACSRASCAPGSEVPERTAWEVLR